jgi:capsular polysaccharide biosynthesis protein
MSTPLYETSAEPPAGLYLRALRYHIWLVVAVTIATLAASAAWLQTRPPRYEATARLLVTPVDGADTSLRGLPLLREAGDMTRVLQTAAAVVDSRDAASQTAKRLGKGWSPNRVKAAVQVEPEGQSNILAVTATAGDAAGAAALANAFAESALEVQARRLRAIAIDAIEVTRDQLAALPGVRSPLGVELSLRLSALRAIASGQNPTLAISDPAAEPRGTVNPSPMIIYGAALIVGLVAGIGAAVLLDALTSRRRLEQLVEEFTTAEEPFAEREARRGRASTG